MGRLSLDNTPLIIVTVPLIVGIGLGLSGVELWICATVLAFGIGAGVWLRKKSGFAIPLFGLVGFGLGVVSVETCDMGYDDRVEIVAQCGGNEVVRGRWHTFDARLVSYLDSTNVWKDASFNVKLSVDTSIEGISAGTIIQARGKLRRIDGSYGLYASRQGFAGRFYGYNVSILGRDSSLYYKSMSGINDYRARISDKIYGIDTADVAGTSIIAALTVGTRSSIPTEINQSYRRSGTSHLLSISGLHVGIIFAILNIVLGALRILPRGQLIFGVVVIGALWGYTLFSGMSPATIRAAVMFSMFQIAIISSRGATSLNILCFSALVLLLFNPRYVFDVGFQLSYIAMVGIVTLYNPIASLIKVRNRVLRAIWSVTVISITAQIATAPIVALTFGQLPLAGVVVNIAVWITVPVIIVGAMAFLATGFDFLGSVALWVADIQNEIITYTASKSWVVVQTDISALTTAIIYAIMIAIVLYINKLQDRDIDSAAVYPL